MEDKCCCFTGHRPEKLPFSCTEPSVDYAILEGKLLQRIIQCYREGYTTFLNGMAEGFDLIAAELVLAARELLSTTALRLVCVLPYRGQADRWAENWRARHAEVLRRADETVVLADHFYPGCFQVRNRYLVDHSDLVVAYYDGTPGGTQGTVKYAQKKGVPVCNLRQSDGEEWANLPIYVAERDDVSADPDGPTDAPPSDAQPAGDPSTNP